MRKGFLLDELAFTPHMKILSDEQIKRFQEAAFEILERIGMKIDHPKARDFLAGPAAKLSTIWSTVLKVQSNPRCPKRRHG